MCDLACKRREIGKIFFVAKLVQKIDAHVTPVEISGEIEQIDASAA